MFSLNCEDVNVCIHMRAHTHTDPCLEFLREYLKTFTFKTEQFC